MQRTYGSVTQLSRPMQGAFPMFKQFDDVKNTKFKAIEAIALPDSVKKTIEEQQARVWRLRNLIECIRTLRL